MQPLAVLLLLITVAANHDALDNLNLNEATCKTQLFWFHAPKTGASFCTTLSHLCCKSKFDAGVRQLNERDGTYHVSVEAECALPQALKDSGNACYSKEGGGGHPALLDDARQLFTVGLFRQPLNRVVAAFFDGASHTEGLSDAEHARLADQWSTYRKPKSKKGRREVTVRKAMDYVMHPSVIGCYTKMLLGYPCHAAAALARDQPFNATALAAALARLRRFNFVGIAEEYEASVALLHRLAGGGTAPHWTEMRGPRALDTHNGDPELRQMVLTNVTTVFSDPYDDEVYRVAKELFAAAKAKAVPKST